MPEHRGARLTLAVWSLRRCDQEGASGEPAAKPVKALESLSTGAGNPVGVGAALGQVEGCVCVCVEEAGVELNGAHGFSFPISI